jgi:hypothetical protein
VVFWNEVFGGKAESVIFALLITNKAMAVTRYKRKARKDKSKSSIRRQSLKNQNFKPVVKGVDVEAIKEEFKAKAASKKKA